MNFLIEHYLSEIKSLKEENTRLRMQIDPFMTQGTVMEIPVVQRDDASQDFHVGATVSIRPGLIRHHREIILEAMHRDGRVRGHAFAMRELSPDHDCTPYLQGLLTSCLRHVALTHGGKPSKIG